METSQDGIPQPNAYSFLEATASNYAHSVKTCISAREGTRPPKCVRNMGAQDL